MMTAGRRRRVRTVAVGLVVFVALMHLVAYSMVGRFAEIGADADKATLVVITGILLLSWSLMVVAGDGIGHPRLLRPLRSRPHPLVAGCRTERLRVRIATLTCFDRADVAAAWRRRSSTF